MSVIMQSSVSVSSLPESDQIRYPAYRMSAGLTSEAQLRYLIKWFGEFSELQREDFLPMLAAAKTGSLNSLADFLAKLSCEDRPISLFHCRMKLFNEWFPSWAEEEQDRLVKGVSEIDPDFGTKLQELLVNGVLPNGYSDEINGHYTPESHKDPEPAEKNEENEREEIVDNLNVEQHINITQPQDSIPVEIAAAL